MKHIHTILTFVVLLAVCQVMSAQTTAPDYVEKLNSLYHRTVPLMTAFKLDSMMAAKAEVTILDTRAKGEYAVSHLDGAHFIDFGKFKKKTIQAMDLDKEAPVVVYCTVGYRSERIGEKLQKLGFSNVHNLYGGILEWVNQGHSVLNSEGKATEKVHTYNKKWGQWLKKGEKVYK